MKDAHSEFAMKIKQMIFLVFIVTNLVACSPETECFIADSIKLVRTIKIEGSNYFIYLRISGFHDKVAFYELYADKPTFDECGKSNTLAISEEPIDSSAGVVSKLVVDEQRLSIVYSKDSSQEVDLKDVPIEVK